MDRAGRKLVRDTVDILKKLHPDWGAKKILSDIKPMLDRQHIQYTSENSLLQNIKYQIKKFNETGTTTIRRSGSGRPVTKSNNQLLNELKRKVLNKRRCSVRKFASKSKLNVSKSTVHRNLRTIAEPYHRQTSSKVTEQHIMKRRKFARWLKRYWKLDPKVPSSKWQRFVNTDFSKPIRLTPQLSIKNDIIWSTSRRDADTHGGYYGREKFSSDVMLWGGISWNDLIPKKVPVFVDEFLDEYQWPK
ncbi:unnamed protein product, partial [Rotaria sp. Silwood1]